MLVVAQTPPPHHGQSIMTEYFLQGEYEGVELHHIRMGFSDDIREVGKARIGKLFHLLGLVTRIASAAFRLGPEAIYYPPASPNLTPFLRDCLLLIGTRWMFSRTIFHFHATGISEFQKTLPRVLQWLYRRAYDAPDLSICLSALAEDDAKDFCSQQIVIVPNGIPDQPEARDRHRSGVGLPTILFLGTVSEEKGAGVLLSALAALVNRKVSFRCLIAGPFATENESVRLRSQCTTLGLDGIVDWRGPVTGTAKWACYNEADIFCFPTYYKTEGFPVVLLEAMMFSLPVVSTTWRAIPEIVLEGQTGFLTAPRDPIATAERLAKLLDHPNLRREMGNAARERFVENYTVSQFHANIGRALALLE